MLTTSFPDYVGLVGVSIILITYFLLQARKVRSDNLTYLLLNIFGSVLIFFSLLYKWNLSAAVIEITWVAISIYGLFKRHISKTKYK